MGLADDIVGRLLDTGRRAVQRAAAEFAKEAKDACAEAQTEFEKQANVKRPLEKVKVEVIREIKD